MPSRRQVYGALGEGLAAAWYAERGFEVVERNWRCANGEIDLVLERQGLIVFCEVKARSSDRFGTAAEAVTPAKQRRIRRSAAAYLSVVNPGGRRKSRAVRFDVACVEGGAVEVIEQAF
jgi:putative endonuclease